MAQELKIQENVELAPFTTLGVGGPARFFVRVKYEAELIEAFRFAHERRMEVLVLGGGSNLVISDKGFDGIVIQVGMQGTYFPPASAEGYVELTAAAGEMWDDVVRDTVEGHLAGLECLSGIPGLVGGTPVQNVGAYGQEVSETIALVRCYDRRDGKIVDLSNEQCGFAYRSSIFNGSAAGRYVVTSVTYRLREGGEPKLVYPELIRELDAGKTGVTSPSVSDVREAILKIRRKKSMVIDPDDPNSRSAGSFFKNPVVTEEVLNSVASVTPDPPFFRMPDGRVKVPAAWLIEQSGFHKGYTAGNVGISEKHSLAIINKGGATADEVIGLMTAIRNAVKEKFGIDLHPEPVLVGF